MKKILSVLAIAAAAFATAPAAAATVGFLNISGYEHGTAPTGTMTVNPAGAFNRQSVTTGVSALSATFTPAFSSSFGDDVLLYCIELFAPVGNFGSNVSYTQNVNPARGGFSIPFSTLQTDRLTKLFQKNFDDTANTGNAGAGGTSNSIASAAMQLAIWEIVYDSGSSNFGDLTAGNIAVDLGQNTGAGEFYSSNVSGARTLAETLLAGIDGYTSTASVVLTSFNNGGSKAGKQDFISAFVQAGDSCPIGNPDCENEVSEPGSLALAGLGVLGLAAASRRRKA